MSAKEENAGDDGNCVLPRTDSPPHKRSRSHPNRSVNCAVITDASEPLLKRTTSAESRPSDDGGILENHSSIYLDFNATTPLDHEVLATINRALHVAWGNPSSSHEAGINAKTIIRESREQVAKMIGVSAEEIIFTSGGTESNNLVLNSAIKHFWDSRNSKKSVAGDEIRPHIVSSGLEHDSIKLVLEYFQQQKIADVTFVRPSFETGRVEVAEVISAIQPLTCLVTVMLANNETGIIQPVAEIGTSLCMKNRDRVESGDSAVLFHTDAAQAVGKIAVNAQKLNVDYLTIVGHKFYGPRIGALYVKHLDKKAGAPLYPMFYGGGQERNFRPGTENTGMIAGLGKACELVTKNIEQYEENMRTARDHLEKQLEVKKTTEIDSVD